MNFETLERINKMNEKNFSNEYDFENYLEAKHIDGCDIYLNSSETYGKGNKETWAYVMDYSKQNPFLKVSLTTA